MEKEKIDRINQLAWLAKERELTDEEKTERQALRQEYIAEWRKAAEATLSSTYLVDEKGNKTKLREKE